MNMITLTLTNQQAEDLYFAASQLYMEYQDDMPADYNESIRRYNNTVDKLRETLKIQIEEQK